jgi:hypothetical protein
MGGQRHVAEEVILDLSNWIRRFEG